MQHLLQGFLKGHAHHIQEFPGIQVLTALVQTGGGPQINLLAVITHSGVDDTQVNVVVGGQAALLAQFPLGGFKWILAGFQLTGGQLPDLLAQRVADEVRAKALVTGECLGQVASQTMEALRVSEDVAELPVLRPLIGMDKEEIIRISRKIGTFDTSILPYEDCCTVFTPRHPKTKPHVEEVRELEAVLDVDALCDRAMAGREFVRIKF